ncbi:DUF7676 family protein [Parvibaculum sp. MBR-TMA-1.3b-4.2]|jgi:hypothetical protein
MQPTPRAEKKNEEGRVVEHIWSLPIEEAFLEKLLRDAFENHYHELTFGPLIPGAAYELKCPGKPERISMGGGYMTIHWGRGGHFHLCLGTNYGSAQSPNQPELIVQRRPSRAEFYRGLDKEGHPVTWGFRMFNGDATPQITLFFPNPFISDEDRVADKPDWSRLAMWAKFLPAYTGCEPDGLDRKGKGFGGG